jgi:hypothetical protein
MSGDKERERHTKAVLDAIEQYTEERMNDEYGRIHTDGSRSGGQPPREGLADELQEAGEHPCRAHLAFGKLLRDGAAALRQPTQSDAVKIPREPTQAMRGD